MPCFRGQLGVALCDHFASPQGPCWSLLVWGSLQAVLHCSHSDEACTCGQLVVASRESQYKIFHFHHGGLDKLSEVFQQWKYCTETHLKDQVLWGQVFPSWVGVGEGSPCQQLRQGAARCWCSGNANHTQGLSWTCVSPSIPVLPGEDHPQHLGSDVARPDRSALSFRHTRCLEIHRDRLEIVSEPFIHLVKRNIPFGECFDKASCHILFNLHTNVIRAL